MRRSARAAKWLPALSGPAAFAGLLVVGQLALILSLPGTALHVQDLGLLARLSLLGYELFLTAAAAALVFGVLTLAGRLTRRSGLNRPPFHHVGVGVRVLAIWLLLLLHAASWTMFWEMRQFLNRHSLAFWLGQPIQVFHWVHPSLIIGVVALTGALAVAAGQWMPRWLAGLPPRAQLGVVAGVLAVVLAGGALAIAGEARARQRDPASRARVTYGQVRQHRAGPFAHAVADVLRRPFDPRTAEFAPDQSIPLIRRPIVSMEGYLQRVDRAGLKRHNVVFILVESLRSDQLRVYGGARDVMPTLDRVARASRVFVNAYIQASHSNYANLVPLSSHYPLRSRDMHDYPERPTYPRVLVYDVLKPLGYRTAIFSSSNENWGGMINYLRTAGLDRLLHPENFDGPTYLNYGDIGFAQWARRSRHAGSIDDRYTVAEAIKWIEQDRRQPFFLQLHMQASHVPYWTPDDFPRRFSPARRDFQILWGKFPRDRVQEVKDYYADSLAYVDHVLDRFFLFLEAAGLADRTIVVVGGDNGEAFYEHGFAAHAADLYNEVVKVPIFIRAPGLAPRLDHRPAQALDIAPTVFDLLGLPPHPSFQGISLLPPTFNPDRSMYMVAQTPLAFQYAIVRSGYKLIYDEWQPRYLLFDQIKDPGETRDLAAGLPELVAPLARRLHAWQLAQIAYYDDPARHAREYPPVLAD